MNIKCEDCAFFKVADLGSFSYGYCHRNAPIPYLSIHEDFRESSVVWPIVNVESWCGEYKEKKDVK